MYSFKYHTLGQNLLNGPPDCILILNSLSCLTVNNGSSLVLFPLTTVFLDHKNSPHTVRILQTYLFTYSLSKFHIVFPYWTYILICRYLYILISLDPYVLDLQNLLASYFFSFLPCTMFVSSLLFLCTNMPRQSVKT